MTAPEPVFESFRNALREALRHDPAGDFGAEAAVAAFDECLALAGMLRQTLSCTHDPRSIQQVVSQYGGSTTMVVMQWCSVCGSCRILPGDWRRPERGALR
jgi:hypothetical protein